MIPGTPLIGTLRDRDHGDERGVYYQILLIFHQALPKSPGLIKVYCPKINQLLVGRMSGLMDLSCQLVDIDSIIITKWEKVIQDYVGVTEDFGIIFHYPHNEASITMTQHNINAAIERYKNFRRKKRNAKRHPTNT